VLLPFAKSSIQIPEGEGARYEIRCSNSVVVGTLSSSGESSTWGKRSSLAHDAAAESVREREKTHWISRYIKHKRQASRRSRKRSIRTGLLPCNRDVQGQGYCQGRAKRRENTLVFCTFALERRNLPAAAGLITVSDVFHEHVNQIESALFTAAVRETRDTHAILRLPPRTYVGKKKIGILDRDGLALSLFRSPRGR